MAKLYIIILILTFIILSLSNSPTNNASLNKTIETKEDQEDDDIDDSSLKIIIQQEIQPLRVDIQNQNKQINEQLQKMEDQFDEQMNKTIQNFTKTADKMAKHLSKKMQGLEKEVNVNIHQTQRITLLMYDEQLSQKNQQIQDLQNEISALELQLPSLGDECQNYFTCKDCIESPSQNCGWCEMEKQCVKGDQEGPFHISCNFYEYGVCRGNQCFQFTDCQGCISNPDCGWCEDENNQNRGCIEIEPFFDGCQQDKMYQIYSQNNECQNIIPVQINQLTSERIQEEASYKDDPVLGEMVQPALKNQLLNKVNRKNIDFLLKLISQKQDTLRELKKRLDQVEREKADIQEQIQQLRQQIQEFENDKLLQSAQRLQFESDPDGEDGEYQENSIIKEEQKELFSSFSERESASQKIEEKRKYVRRKQNSQLYLSPQ